MCCVSACLSLLDMPSIGTFPQTNKAEQRERGFMRERGWRRRHGTDVSWMETRLEDRGGSPIPSQKSRLP